MSIKNLESKVFQDEIDFKTFESILEFFNVTPKKISREEFNNLKGNFFREIGEEKGIKKYNLFLPDDLKVFELPSIISRVNKITFGDILPDYASKEELKVKITITINTLLQVLSEKTLNDEEKKDIQKAIKKYVKLFKDLYGTEVAQKLSNENFRKEIIEKSKLSQSYERFKDYQTNLERIKTKEKLGDLLSEVEESLSGEVIEHFDESFFERSINMLDFGMMTITQAEQEAKIKYYEENGYKKEILPNGNIGYRKGGDIIVISIETKNLDEKERLLRDKIGIDSLKKELEKVRSYGNQELINETELNATNKILKVLYEYLYQLTGNNYGYQPSKIAKFKEIYCVGFSLLGHAFLSELRIKHNGLDIPGHSALEINIGLKRYYFDATYKNELEKIKVTGKNGMYQEITLSNGNIKEIFSGNAESIILGQIFNNEGVSRKKIGLNEYSLRLYYKAIKLRKNNIKIYLNRFNSLKEKYKKTKDTKLLEDDILPTSNFEKALYFYHKGQFLGDIKEYKKSLQAYNEAIKLLPVFEKAYFYKGESLKKLGKNKVGELYIYSALKMGGQNLIFEILYREEKDKITDFIEKKDFNGLRLYLLEIEKEDN